MSPPSKSRIRAQQDRQSSLDLLEVYGSLLTPKQYAMTAGYCVEGKTFSQIAREQGVSRQAVHEAVRGVQRLLNYYEEKLKLKASPRGAGADGAAEETATSGPVSAAVDRLEALRGKVTRKGVIYTPDWIIREIDDTIRVLEEDTSYRIPAEKNKAPKRTTRAAPIAKKAKAS